MNYQNTRLLNVKMTHHKKEFEVGTLILKDFDVYFEYDQEFINNNIEISPLKLPLKPGIHKGDKKIFDGLFGVFNDSLPDSWGQLLIQRQLRKQKINPNNLNTLDRLRILDSNSLGAFQYQSGNEDFLELAVTKKEEEINLVKLNNYSSKVLDDKELSKVNLENLVKLGFSSGGARPKSMVKVSKDKNKIIFSTNHKKNYEDWIIKFPSKFDNKEIPIIEFTYNQMAKKSGIEVPEFYLFKSNKKSFFGTKRFDRKNNSPIHVHSASGLLHSDFRYPSLDYDSLMRLGFALCKDLNEVSKIFRLAVFNVLSHNRDDHSKNFSFYLNENNQWKLAPAYDLTFSNGPGGEHSTTVDGEGKKPSKKHLMALAHKHKINNAEEIYDEVNKAVSTWPELAKSIGISSKNIKQISSKICLNKYN